MFSTILAIAIGTNFLFQFWLDQRHLQYVRAHQNSVPAPFAETVSLADHRKAADYTIANLPAPGQAPAGNAIGA